MNCKVAEATGVANGLHGCSGCRIAAATGVAGIAAGLQQLQGCNSHWCDEPRCRTAAAIGVANQLQVCSSHRIGRPAAGLQQPPEWQ